MTKQELNRDINRMYINYISNKNNTIMKFDYNAMFEEYRRLYYADDELKYMNKKSIRIMLILNRIYRIIPFHMFGIGMTV